MEVIAYRDASAFDELKDEWQVLVEHSCTNTIFSTWEWHKNWWHAYHPGDLWVLAIRGDGNRLLGIASMFIEHNETHGRTVRHVGCEDVTDYLDFIIDRDCTGPVYQALVSYLVAHQDEYDLLNLCNVPEASPSTQAFVDGLKAENYDVTVSQQDVCPVIELPEDFETYLSNLDKKQRHEVRRKLRRAEGQRKMGSLDWYIVDESHDLEVEMDHFLRLMAASHPEKAGFLEEGTHVTFFKSIVPAALARGWLQLNFLTINETPVATYLNFDYNDHILVYNSGLDPEEYGQFSPGIVLLAYTIEHAIEEGRELFDFLRGDEQYKYRMGGKDTTVLNVRAQRAN